MTAAGLAQAISKRILAFIVSFPFFAAQGTGAYQYRGAKKAVCSIGFPTGGSLEGLSEKTSTKLG
jgi:hypothetical protein